MRRTYGPEQHRGECRHWCGPSGGGTSRSAQTRDTATTRRRCDSIGGGHSAVIDVAGGAVQEISHPRGKSCRTARTSCFSSSILMSPQPETQHLPMPRAWQQRERSCRRGRSGCPEQPSCLRCPRERSPDGPGPPSRRAQPISLASSAEKTILPEAAPGGTQSLADDGGLLQGLSVKLGMQQRVSRREPGSIGHGLLLPSIMPSSTRSQAIFRAAAGVRLPLRVWSM